MLEIRQCRTRALINLELLVVERLRTRCVSLTGRDLGCTDMSVDFVDILAKLDKINRITDGW